jgi:ArsR family transcriptional regulator
MGEEMEQLLQVYKALGEEMRLRMFMLLLHGELCVCDVMEILGEPQPKVSRHLAYLKNSGLLKSKRAGVWMHYSLKEPQDELVGAHIRFLQEHVSRLPLFQKDAMRIDEVKRRKLCERTAGNSTNSAAKAETKGQKRRPSDGRRTR